MRSNVLETPPKQIYRKAAKPNENQRTKGHTQNAGENGEEKTYIYSQVVQGRRFEKTAAQPVSVCRGDGRRALPPTAPNPGRQQFIYKKQAEGGRADTLRPVAPRPRIASPKERADPERQPIAPEKQKKQAPLWLRIVSNVVYFGFIAAILGAAFLFAGSSNADKSLFGYRIYNVLSSSMEPELPVGSLIFTRVTQPHELEKGDYVTYYLGKSARDYRTHQIIQVHVNYQNTGQPAFTTQGINSAHPDNEIVTGNMVVGKVAFCLPKMGFALQWISGNLLVVGVFFGLILLFMWVMRRFVLGTPQQELSPERDGKGKKSLSV